MLRIAISIALIMHGLAQVSGFLHAWTRLDVGYHNRGIIFSTTVKAGGSIGKVLSLLWLIAMFCLISGGVLLWSRELLSDTFILAGAAISLFSCVLWWRDIPLGAKLGSFFNLILLAILITPLLDRWHEILIVQA